MSDSGISESIAVRRPGKHDRLVPEGRQLVYRQGVEKTTLAEIAAAADVPLGTASRPKMRSRTSLWKLVSRAWRQPSWPPAASHSQAANSRAGPDPSLLLRMAVRMGPFARSGEGRETSMPGLTPWPYL
jgi:hypothetical protein